MKILIAIPTYENIYPDTYKSVYDLDTADHEIAFEFVRGYDCATARNRIAQRSLDLGVDYVLMVDNDVVLPSDTLLKLLEYPVDVCLGYYPHRNNDNKYNGRTCVCKLRDENGQEYYNYPLSSEYTAKELKKMAEDGAKKIPIHGGGMGCALISTSVFRKLPYPWYDWVNYDDDHRGMLSEDLYFCVKCKNGNIPIHTDVRVGTGHLFRYVQWPE